MKTTKEKLDAIELLLIQYDEGEEIETDEQLISKIREIIEEKP